jgi:hypothetical protein
MRGQRIFQVSMAVGLLCQSVWAQSEATESDVRAELMNALVQRKSFSGQSSGRSSSPGTFCDNIQEHSLRWSAEMGDVELDFSPQGSADFRASFGHSFVEATGWRQGGFLCIWSGGTGRVSVGRSEIEFSLFPVKAGEKPKIEIRGARVRGLKIDQVSLALPFVTLENTEAPNWMNEWVEDSANGLVKAFMATGLKNRLDSHISQKVKDFLDKFQAKPNSKTINVY